MDKSRYALHRVNVAAKNAREGKGKAEWVFLWGKLFFKLAAEEREARYEQFKESEDAL